MTHTKTNPLQEKTNENNPAIFSCTSSISWIKKQNHLLLVSYDGSTNKAKEYGAINCCMCKNKSRILIGPISSIISIPNSYFFFEKQQIIRSHRQGWPWSQVLGTQQPVSPQESDVNALGSFFFLGKKNYFNLLKKILRNQVSYFHVFVVTSGKGITILVAFTWDSLQKHVFWGILVYTQ